MRRHALTARVQDEILNQIYVLNPADFVMAVERNITADLKVGAGVVTELGTFTTKHTHTHGI